MLNIGVLHEGFVLDHIEAGRSMEIYKYLNLDKFDCCVAIIKNARSNKMGKKDIIKIECPIDQIDLDVLGFIDHNITVNIIKDDAVVEKKRLSLPKEIKNIVKCKNPRAYGGWKGALVGSFIVGMALTGLPLILYPAFSALGIAGASFPNVDYNIIGAIMHWILGIFH